MLKIIYKIPALLLISALFLTTNANATCQAMFRIEKVTDRSFKILDSSVCNKSATTYKMVITDGVTSNTYYNYFNGSPYAISWSKDVTVWVHLTITDSTGSGCSDSVSHSIDIKSNTCNSQFSVGFTNPPSMNAVFYYNNNQYTANTRFKIDFGDGNTSTTRNPTHTYANCGTYTLKLFVKDSVIGCQDSMAKVLRVGLKANFSSQLVFGRQYQFSNLSEFSGMYLGYPDSLYKSYHWEFGDGDTSNQQMPYHTYSTPGTYVVKLIANYTHPNNGCNKHDTMIANLIVGCKGTAEFTYSYVNTRQYGFTSIASKNLQHFWDFGDGNTSTTTDPLHTYAAVQKKYTVKLVLTDTTAGCSDTAVYDVYHQCNINALLDLSYDSTQPYKATLTNNSTGFISNHFWDFGDGSTSTSASPVHTYTKTGAIVLIYKAKDTFANCERTDTIRFWIDSMGGLKRQAFVMTIIDKTESSTSSIKTQQKAALLNVYPNPFNNQIEIANEGEVIKQVNFYSLTGAEIKVSVNIVGGNQKIQLPDNLPAGFYLLHVQTASGTSHYKLMKQ
ncbi:MAG: PKD domain-containing protein [Bacteroidota bacterium]